MTRYVLRFHATPTAVVGSANADPDGPWVAWSDVDAELTRLRTALAESEAMRGRQMKTIDAMRGTIRVLGKECRAWRDSEHARHSVECEYQGDPYCGACAKEKTVAQCSAAVDSDPAARAAMEGA